MIKKSLLALPMLIVSLFVVGSCSAATPTKKVQDPAVTKFVKTWGEIITLNKQIIAIENKLNIDSKDGDTSATKLKILDKANTEITSLLVIVDKINVKLVTLDKDASKIKDVKAKTAGKNMAQTYIEVFKYMKVLIADQKGLLAVLKEMTVTESKGQKVDTKAIEAKMQPLLIKMMNTASKVQNSSDKAKAYKLNFIKLTGVSLVDIETK